MQRSLNLSTKIALTVTSNSLYGKPNLFFQQTRTTYILKRKNKVRLFKKEDKIRKLTRQDFFYEVVENTDLKKKPLLDVILLENIKEFGNKGEVIKVKPIVGYNKLLLPKLAVYATPENLKKYEIQKVEQDTGSKYKLSFVPGMLEILKRCCLPVNMSSTNPWTLEKKHIRVNFRLAGIHLTDESITMPEKTICGPNLKNEGKEFYVTVTINKTEREYVRCRLLHIINKKYEYDEKIPPYLKPGPAIFPEDQSILDSLLRPRWEDKFINIE